jgi:hypothetical protein
MYDTTLDVGLLRKIKILAAARGGLSKNPGTISAFIGSVDPENQDRC